MNARTLIPFITGSAYNYADGEIWPEWRHHTLRLVAKRLAMACGFRSRIKARKLGKVWPRVAPTMIGELRALNIVQMIEKLDDDNVHGSLVDCGVWRGGSTMLMAAASPNRQVYCCDTFLGFPKEDAARENVPCPKALAVSQGKVFLNFVKYGVPVNRVCFVRGKVQNTLCDIPKPVALIRIDVDMAEPVHACLSQLWPKLSSGGWVIVDDYGCKYYRCREAVDSFRNINGGGPIHWIDEEGICYQKQ